MLEYHIAYLMSSDMSTLNKIATFIWQNTAIIIAVVISLLIVKMCESPAPTFAVNPNVKVIDKRIEEKGDVINKYTVASDNGKKVINALNGRVDELMAELDYLKGLRDTFNIVPIQDTLIHVLYAQGQVKDGVIRNQDTIIQAQRYIIGSKDTIIAVKDGKIKGLRRKLTWSLIGNGVLAGLLIIK